MPAASAAAGINVEKEQHWTKNMLFSFVVASCIALLYECGTLLGSSFIYILRDFDKAVVICLCAAIAFRMILDTLSIKNGRKIIVPQKTRDMFLLGLVSGINAFLAGLFHEFWPLSERPAFLYIGLAAFVWALIFTFVRFSQTKLLLNSFINLVSALIILISGIIYII